MFYDRHLKLLTFFGIFVFISPLTLPAQSPVSWSLESDVKGKTVKANESFKADLKAQIEENWHLYAVEQPEGGPFPTKITLPEDSFFKIEGKIESSKPIIKPDANFLIDEKPLETKYFEKEAEFNLPIVATREINTNDLMVNVRFQVCDDKVCLPPKTVKVSFSGFEDAKKSGQQSVVSSQQDANPTSADSNSN
ncbi:MAG: protein-disulfide reductase DsbD N-terminal domain-containing protein [Pyrinomonadaceae bacterium]